MGAAGQANAAGEPAGRHLHLLERENEIHNKSFVVPTDALGRPAGLTTSPLGPVSDPAALTSDIARVAGTGNS